MTKKSAPSTSRSKENVKKHEQFANEQMHLPEVSTQVMAAQKLAKSEFSKGQALLILTTESRLSKLVLPVALKARLQTQLDRADEKPKAGALISLPAQSAKDADVAISLYPTDSSAFELLTHAKKSLKALLQKTHTNLFIFIDGAKDENLVADCLGSALAARLFQMPLFGKKTEKLKPWHLKEVSLLGGKTIEKSFVTGFSKGNGSNVVRYLATLPPNILDPQTYHQRIKKLCAQFGFEHSFHSSKQLAQMGAGSFYAVDRGDPESAGGIHEMTYNPRGAKNKDWICLVGKGLCFDTGGYDIKTGGFMATMKGDMGGSAVAIANMIVAATLKLPIKMKAFLGVTKNLISPVAYTCDEVVTAMNGVSIEVVNTDAEGRMVLADVLCLADKAKPSLIMDFATLTGSAVRSIGTQWSAGFTNQDKWHSKIVECGAESGERVWTFPTPKEYEKKLESPIADTLQCSRSTGIDHILAAIFLKKFVGEKTPWVHIDLASAENDGGLAHTDTMFTGYGVRFSIEFLRNFAKV